MIDRQARLRRHRVRVTSPDPGSCLDLGNGRFALTVDVTGLQTLPERYPLPDRSGGPTGTLLGTSAEWAWHSRPPRPEEAGGLDSTLRDYDTWRGPVPHVDLGTSDPGGTGGLTATERWLRGNPHRIDLGRFALTVGGGMPTADDLDDVDQQLDLGSGTVTSRFSVRGRRLVVRTAVHPDRDAVGVVVEAEPGDPVGLQLAFPAGAEWWGGAADWGRPDAHTTTVRADGEDWRVDRVLDATRYAVHVGGTGLDVTGAAAHAVAVTGGASGLAVVLELLPDGRRPAALDAEGVLAASTRSWTAFWADGACLDLSGTDAPEAVELERRVVLSEYLTRVHSSGTLPPAETGLTVSSWWGRPHLEMHWWHAAHFATWGRPELLEPSLGWYERIRPLARETARRQRLPGVRWPKQANPDGTEVPSDIGPFILWQQPHPVHLAELVRRARPDDRDVVERLAPLVLETAECMAAMLQPDPDGWSLPPPLVPAQESYAADRARVRDPAFELAYWAWALEVAEQWRERIGLPAAGWREVARRARRPLVRDGVLQAVGVPPYTVRTDHPSMLGALGVVPAGRLVEPADVRRTLESVLTDWDWSSTWGWDFPMAAMTATRLGLPEVAAEVLLRPEAKNRYLPNGHNHQDATLPRYLPGNGGTLAAVALMAGGFDGAPDVPRFPAGWRVEHEGFVRSP